MSSSAIHLALVTALLLLAGAGKATAKEPPRSAAKAASRPRAVGRGPDATSTSTATATPGSTATASSTAAADAGAPRASTPTEAWTVTLAQPEPAPGPAAAADEGAPGGGRSGFHFRLGGLSVIPTGGPSGEVQLANVSGQARLSGLSDGPIAGSSTSLGNASLVAGVVGWAPPILNRQLSVETILALPFKQKLYARGTLADRSLAPNALGTLPTGVPALGRNLGEVTVLPPVVTAVYRFLPSWPVRPYLGAGGCLLLVLDGKITNPVLTSVHTSRIDIPPTLGWVAQAGLEVRISPALARGRAFWLTADVKYIGGLSVTAKVRDLWVTTPSLPIYGSVPVGDNIVHMSIDPIVAFMGVGMDL